ncbi:MAG TPA: hypothetical protein VME92_22375 [Acetobacteraceae bacterium]|nr:hypothetical protein [Acetobacteraceae bacterium]
MDPQQAAQPRGDGATWTAFLSMAFVLVGLTGLFATFAAPVPYERGMAQEGLLDAVLASEAAADPAAARAALRPALQAALGSGADQVLSGPGPLADRVARARLALRARVRAEAASVVLHLRFLVAAFTIAGAVFGAAVISILRRAR